MIAAPLPVCKSDGSESDGDVRGISGLGTTTESWNGESCQISAKKSTPAEDKSFTDDVIKYLKSKDQTKLTSLYTRMATNGPKSIST